MALEDHVDYDLAEHEARLICGDPQACAWAWIEAYAKNLSDDVYDDEDYGYGKVTADELVETALSNLESTSRWGGEYLNKGGLLEGKSTDPVFWEKLAVLKGIEIPHEKRESFFTCSC